MCVEREMSNLGIGEMLILTIVDTGILSTMIVRSSTIYARRSLFSLTRAQMEWRHQLGAPVSWPSEDQLLGRPEWTASI